MRRTQDIGVIGCQWIAIASTHQWLGRKMKHDLRIGIAYEACDPVGVTDIAFTTAQDVVHFGERKQVRAAFGRQGQPSHLGSEAI